MNLYDVRASLHLSDLAKTLDPEVIVGVAQIAEDALGLTGTTYTGAAAERAKLAVVRQVNRIVAEPGDPFLLSHTRNTESKTWDSRAAATAKTVPLDPYAILIVEALAREAAGEDEGSYLLVPTLRWR